MMADLAADAGRADPGPLGDHLIMMPSATSLSTVCYVGINPFPSRSLSRRLGRDGLSGVARSHSSSK